MTILFAIISLLLLTSAVSIIIAKNPIHSVLYLILVFIGASGLLILLKAEFLGMIFLIIYIGAISVLFLFIIMMLNIRMIELRENLIKYVPITILIGTVLLVELLYLFFNFNINIGVNDFNFTNLNIQIEVETYINYFLINNQITPTPHNLKLVAFLIYTYYVDFFIICGLILFAAMIGTIILTLHTEFNSRKQDLFLQINRNLHNTIVNIKP